MVDNYPEICVNIQKKYTELLVVTAKLRKQIVIGSLYSFIQGSRQSLPLLLATLLLVTTSSLISSQYTFVKTYETTLAYIPIPLLLIVLFTQLLSPRKAYYGGYRDLIRIYSRLSRVKRFYRAVLVSCLNEKR